MFFLIFLLKTRSKLSGNVDESRGLRFRWSHVGRPLKCDDIAILVPCAVACKRTAFTEIIYSNRLWYETPGHPLRHPLKGKRVGTIRKSFRDNNHKNLNGNPRLKRN